FRLRRARVVDRPRVRDFASRHVPGPRRVLDGRILGLARGHRLIVRVGLLRVHVEPNARCVPRTGAGLRFARRPGRVRAAVAGALNPLFSGIVKGVGRILERRDFDADTRIVIATGGVPLGTLELGASIAVNGVCLTAIELGDERFAADVSAETLRVTTLGALAPGAAVNLEPSLRLGDPLDGHLVAGHVDGVGRVIAVRPQGRSTEIELEVPEGLERYVAQKGSIAVDG